MVTEIICILFLAVFMGIVIYTIHYGMSGIDSMTKKRAGMGCLISMLVPLVVILVILGLFLLL